ncbi:hypothetical protein IAT40_004328 [Kwoniella sp. CBS 6097]
MTDRSQPQPQARPGGPRLDNSNNTSSKPQPQPQPLHTIPLHRSNPTSPTRHHHSHHHPDQSGPVQHHGGSSATQPHSPRYQESDSLHKTQVHRDVHQHRHHDTHHPLSPNHQSQTHNNNHRQQHKHAHETDPMLSPQRGSRELPSHPHSHHHHHPYPHPPQEAHIDPRHNHVMGEPDSPTNAVAAEPTGDTSSGPAPPPKSPKSPTSLSKRLLFALTHKAPISRTWEKKALNTPRSRPMSFYASPAEIAAFKPLPLVDGPHPHHHSAPVTPAPSARG